MLFKVNVLKESTDSLQTVELEEFFGGWGIGGTGSIWDNKDASPEGDVLFDMLRSQFFIGIPEQAPDVLSDIWKSIDLGQIEYEEAQNRLTQLFNWINDCHISKPRWDD
ncbi:MULTISPECIES: hypothetical protein [unclassified Pseudoalteromonas]|jgi:hypothetical protein|uniref:hypothetical protein n=1 Tax=unclassified Pseudoalteromonas TaxID=194690 RepID=UPI0004906216|nr:MULTISPECIES: hypothetical protein [unclassified Pseudoalteromonas]TMP68165.1 hypothetical protein CWB76_15625 [Pseudoalteromonas sp. S1609]